MSDAREHHLINDVRRDFAEGRMDRREFIRTATLLGLSAGAAYAFAGQVSGQGMVAPAAAQSIPKGGTLRISMRCQDLKSPHT